MWRDNMSFLLVVENEGLELFICKGKQAPTDATLRVEAQNNLASLDKGLSELAARWRTRQELMPKRVLSRPKLSVLLGSGWFDGGIVPWNPTASTGAALKAYAENFLRAEGLDIRNGDTVCLTDGSYQKARWAVIYSDEVLQRLSRFASEIGASLDYVQPIASVVAKCCKHLKVGPAVCVLYETGATSIWLCEGGNASLLGSIIGGDRSPEDLASDGELLWKRLQLRQCALAEVEHVYHLDLILPDSQDASLRRIGEALPVGGLGPHPTPPILALAHIADRLASVAAVSRVSVIGRPQAYVLASILGILGLLLISMSRSGIAETALNKQLLAVTTSQIAPRMEPLSKADKDRIVAANIAVGELNLPVEKLLRAIQPPKDIRVAVLSVEFSPEMTEGGGATLKLNAEARSGEEMVRYAAFLADRKPIFDTNLLSHEIVDSDGVKPYRFKLEALWRD